MEASLLLAIALIAANLPFFVERLFFFKLPAAGSKHLGWRLLELVVLYFVVGGIGLLLEKKGGDIHAQNWEFYAVTASLFVVFAFPGFVYRYLWRKQGARPETRKAGRDPASSSPPRDCGGLVDLSRRSPRRW